MQAIADMLRKERCRQHTRQLWNFVPSSMRKEMVHQSDMNRLFFEDGVCGLLKQREQNVKDEVEKLRIDDFRGSSDQKLADEIVASLTPAVPELFEERICIADKGACKVTKHQFGEEVKIDGKFVEFEVPFEGNSKWFKYRASSYTLNPPCAEVKTGTLSFRFESTEDEADADAFKSAFDGALSQIEQSLATVRSDVEQWVEQQTDRARSLIKRRRENELGAEAITQALNFPLKKRRGAPKTYNLPKKRPPVSVRSTSRKSPEDVRLADDDYEHILRVMRNMAWVMEKSPSDFVSLDEEDLRFHFLVQLNGQFEGQAVGEAFNYQGKTDILIGHEGRNLFIGECKFWKGPKGFTETVDQLLGYTCWRDTKTAIVLFSRNKNFTNVLDQIEPVVEDHPSYVRTLKRPEETEFGFVLRHPDDSKRHLTLTVMAFDVPSPE